MKKSITILALACLAVVSIRAQFYMRQVNSLADLVNINPSDLYKTYNVVNRTSENDGFGGMFYITNNATGTNLGTKIALATNGWSAVRIYSSPVNVRWFGADATGSADSTAAIQAAIDAASGTTKAVYVPKGTYKLVTGITLPGRVKLFGDNQLNSILQFTPTADSGTAITVSASDNTYIEDISLTKSGSFTNLTGIAIASTGTTTELKMRRVTVDGFDKYGLNLTTTSFTAYNEIQSCRFLNNRRTDANTNNPPAVAIYAAPNQIHATTIANCRFGGNDHCLAILAKGDGLVIRDNQFETSGFNAAGTAMIGTNLFDTILIDQAEGLVFQGNYVEKNIHGSGYGFLNLTNCNSPLILGGMFYNDTSGTAYTTNSVRLTGTTRNAKIMGAHFNTVAGSGSGHKFVNAATEGIGELDHCTLIGGAGALTTISTINPYITNVRVRLQGGVIGLSNNDATKPILTLDRGSIKHSFHQDSDILRIRDGTAGKDRILLNTTGKVGITDGSFPSGGATRLLHLLGDDAETNTVNYALRLEHTLIGTNVYSTNGFGTGIEFFGDREEGGTNSTTGIMGAIDARWSDPKVGQEDSDLALKPVLNGTATEVVTVRSSGRVGINNTAPDTTLGVVGNALFKAASDSATNFSVFSSGSTRVFTVDTSNTRVGIGNSAPSAPLHVVTAANPAVIIGASGTMDFRVAPSSTPGSASVALRSMDGTTSGISFHTRNDAGTAERVTINGIGNVVIAPTWATNGATQTGFMVNATDSGPSAAASLLADFQVGGVSQASVSKAGVFKVIETGTIGFTNDVILARDAANILAQRNGANAQTLNIYGTYTDASNYERVRIAATTSDTFILNEHAGTGTANALTIGTSSSGGNLVFRTGGNDQWRIDSTGNILAASDGADDIGQSGGNRPRNIYLSQTIGGMSLVQLQSGGIIEFGVGTRSKISSPSDGLILLQNTASTDFTRLIFGSNDANGFSIKKSGTSALRIVNGNDTADTDIWARKFGATSSSARSIFNSSAGGGVSLSSSGQYQWTSTTTGDTTGDAGISRNAPGEVKITDGGSGFGSLLLSNATLHGRLILNPTALQTLAAGSPIVAVASKVRVAGSGGAVTLTATPTIADGTDGQLVYILGTDDTNTLTVQDQGTLASSNLELAAATRVLGKGDILVLMFDNTDSVWYEVSFSNN